MAPDQLERYRQAVASDGTGRALEQTITSLTGAKIDVHGTDALKTAPKGYPKDHPRVELLRYRGVVAMKQWPAAAWLGTSAAKTRIVDTFRAARPLCEWLELNVGPSTMPAAPRGR
jgi:hypothetical protein